MKRQISMRRIEAEVKGMTREALAEFVLRHARELEPDARFDYARRLGIPYEETSVSADDLARAIDRLGTERCAVALQIPSSDSGYYDEEYFHYEDTQGTGAQVVRIFEGLDELAARGEYREAERLYERLRDVRISSYDASDLGYDLDDFDIARLCEEGILDICLVREAAACLLAVYRGCDGAEARARRLTGHWAWTAWGIVTADAFLQTVKLPLPERDAFLSAWIEEMIERQDVAAPELLREATVLREGRDALGPLARKMAACYPSYSSDWFEELFLRGALAQVCEEAEETQALLSAAPGVRAKVARFACRAAMGVGKPELAANMAWVCFDAAPNVHNLLRLLTMRDGEALYDRACARPGDSRRMRFFQGDFEAALCGQTPNMGREYSDEICWTLFLIVPQTRLTATAKEALKWLAAPLSIIEDEQDEPWLKLYARWRERLSGGFEECIPRVQEAVLHRIERIVSEQLRGEYERAAIWAILSGEAMAAMGVVREPKQLVGKIRQMFPRHRAFQQEFVRRGY